MHQERFLVKFNYLIFHFLLDFSKSKVFKLAKIGLNSLYYTPR